MERRLVFRSAEEFQSRPNYQPEINSKDHELIDIIGEYEFDKKHALHCGLCGTLHWTKGFVIVTTQGVETNIGGQCGNTHFGKKYEEKYVRYQELKRQEELRNQVVAFLAERSTLLSDALALLPWLEGMEQRLNEIKTKIGKAPTLDSALTAIIRNGGSIYRETMTLSSFDAAQGKTTPQAHRELLAQVVSVEALSLKLDGASLLKCQVVARLKLMPSDGVEHLDMKRVSQLADDMRTIRDTFGECQKQRDILAAFLNQENLKRLAKLQPSDGKYPSRVQRILGFLDRQGADKAA